MQLFQYAVNGQNLLNAGKPTCKRNSEGGLGSCAELALYHMQQCREKLLLRAGKPFPLFNQVWDMWDPRLTETTNVRGLKSEPPLPLLLYEKILLASDMHTSSLQVTSEQQ